MESFAGVTPRATTNITGTLEGSIRSLKEKDNNYSETFHSKSNRNNKFRVILIVHVR